ncbi:MAG: hypothetical protein PHV43_02515 [Candidatus Colwellbacteria bacterium]|nr:hypothetical protein [Candidatus Colwellbacteria bacterium]
MLRTITVSKAVYQRILKAFGIRTWGHPNKWDRQVSIRSEFHVHKSEKPAADGSPQYVLSFYGEGEEIREMYRCADNIIASAQFAKMAGNTP